MGDCMGSNTKDYLLTDLISLERLQRLVDVFSETNEVASSIEDEAGEMITEPAYFCDVCKIIRSTTKGKEACLHSATFLGREASKTHLPVFRPCLSIGFYDAKIPVIVEGRHVANWSMGQYCVGNIDEFMSRKMVLSFLSFEESDSICSASS